MKAIKNRHRWISWCIILSFLFLIEVSSLPALGERTSSGGDRSIERDADGAGAVEKVSASKPKVKKKSILPWIIAGVGVVAAAAAYYFLVVNKKYTLTVTLAEGVTGTPAAGSYKHKKGSSVSYSYTLSGGFKDLQVMLDGQPAAASGTIKMKADHNLSVSSTKIASIAVNSTPDGALIYDNGVFTGKTTNTILEYGSAGSHQILVRKCGYKDVAQTVQAEMGVQKTVNASLVQGVQEDFDVVLASCWKTTDAQEWSVADGLLKGVAPGGTGNPILYDVPFDSANATLAVRMNMIKGSLTSGQTLWGIVLCETNDLTAMKGYALWLYNMGVYYCLRFDGVNLRFVSGTAVPYSGGWAPSANVMSGWNTFKAVRSGSNYSFIINDVTYATITDTKYNPKYIGFFFASAQNSEFHIDYVKLDLTAAAVPAQPATIRYFPQNLLKKNFLDFN